MDTLWLRLALATALCPLVACSSGGDDSGAPPPPPPPPPPGELFEGYGQTEALSLPILATITELAPVGANAAITGYSVDPALPSGLMLDSTTGVISGAPDVIVAEMTYTITATDGTESDEETIVLGVRNPQVFISSDRPLVITDIAGVGSVPLSANFSPGLFLEPPTAVAFLNENESPIDSFESLVDLENVPGTTSDVPRALGDSSTALSAVITVSDSELDEDLGWTFTPQAPYDTLMVGLPTFLFSSADILIEDGTLGLDFELPSSPTTPALGPFSTNTIHTELLQLAQVSDPLLAGAADGEWTELNGVFYGAIEDFEGDVELYAFTPADGSTAAILERVSDTNPRTDPPSPPGAASDEPVVLGTLGNQLVFTALRETLPSGPPPYRALFLLDPTSNSIQQVADINDDMDDMIGEIADLEGNLAFTAVNSAGNSDLYFYSPGGFPTLVSDTSDDAPGGDVPQSLTALDGLLFYTALDVNGERRLYSYDPATDEQNLLSTTDNLNPDELVVLDGILYLTAENANGFRKLFRWDDASNALVQITDFQEDPMVSDDPQNLLAFNGDLYFTAMRTEDGAPPGGVQKLHRYQPTFVPLRAELLTNTAGDSLVSDNISDLVVAGTEVVFLADNENGARKLFSFNDATGEVRQIIEINDDMTDDEFGEMQAFGSGKLGLVLLDSGLGTRNLGVYDTLNRIAYRAADTTMGAPAGDDVALRAAANGSLFFTANDSSGNQRIYGLE